MCINDLYISFTLLSGVLVVGLVVVNYRFSLMYIYIYTIIIITIELCRTVWTLKFTMLHYVLVREKERKWSWDGFWFHRKSQSIIYDIVIVSESNANLFLTQFTNEITHLFLKDTFKHTTIIHDTIIILLRKCAYDHKNSSIAYCIYKKE